MYGMLVDEFRMARREGERVPPRAEFRLIRDILYSGICLGSRDRKGMKGIDHDTMAKILS